MREKKTLLNSVHATSVRPQQQQQQNTYMHT